MVDRSGEHFGNYRLVRLLGQGGYAEVYLGQHVRFRKQAAIKVLHAHLSELEAEHFQQEAETVATLAHPGIVQVFDYDVQDGIPFLVMDYASGGSLRQRYPKGSLVPLPVIVSSVKQVSDALQYAHEQKFIHRDVKPENMLLGRRQEIVLSDFGIAIIAQSTSSLNTSAQGTSGTLAYMTPEQIEGHPRPASDQYALGVVVYEWLCGERPFEGSVSELVAQQLSMPPPPLRERVPSIPVEVEQVVLRALAKDAKARFVSVADFATALEQASQHAVALTAQQALERPNPRPLTSASVETVAGAPGQPMLPAETTPEASLPVEVLEPTIYPGSSAHHGTDTPQGGAVSETLQPGQVVAPTAAVISPPLEPTMPVHRRASRVSFTMAGLLIGLAILVVAGAVLGSISLLTHFGVIGTSSSSPAPIVARGGTWTYGLPYDAGSLIPNGDLPGTASGIMDQALYLPLFSGDAQGVIHAVAATEVPSIQNEGVSADATTWTFHLRPHLVWSDGAPYDARDVDFTWKLWSNPKFGANTTLGLTLISSASVSADRLSITFHLTRPFAPFLADLWVDGIFAPLPAHHFSSMSPAQILKSPDNLNPKVVSGPFMMGESVPGDHYTVVRNPRYYLAREGLPYLDRIVFSVLDMLPAMLEKLQAGALDATGLIPPSPGDFQAMQRLKDYTLIYPPTQNAFEALYFNFHNIVLANHPEVRQAMAIAVDQRAIITGALKGLGTELCTDHPSAYHPGYESLPPCPVFSLAVANQVLDDNGWVRGSDGVRTKDGQRLEFKYSTTANSRPERADVQTIIQHDLGQIGIKLDIQNYSAQTFFGSLLPQGKASPPSGAVAGRYDIAEFTTNLSYDPDDSVLFACDQFPSAANHFTGANLGFYCNPALDKLFAQEQATADSGVRQQLFEQIHQIYLTQYPFIVLYSPTVYALVHKGTHNYLPGPFGDTYNIAEWWCDNGKC
jgi:ABC-type transport system substrate-binding protein/serine/threonine protein kinase